MKTAREVDAREFDLLEPVICPDTRADWRAPQLVMVRPLVPFATYV